MTSSFDLGRQRHQPPQAASCGPPAGSSSLSPEAGAGTRIFRRDPIEWIASAAYVHNDPEDPVGTVERIVHRIGAQRIELRRLQEKVNSLETTLYQRKTGFPF